jgi:dual oxidase maturation factor 1
MAAFGHTFPFYADPKPTFPMDTTLAVIITIFLTALVTFIIILPGIRGKTVRNKPSPRDPSPRKTSASQ